MCRILAKHYTNDANPYRPSTSTSIFDRAEIAKAPMIVIRFFTYTLVPYSR